MSSMLVVRALCKNGRVMQGLGFSAVRNKLVDSQGCCRHMSGSLTGKKLDMNIDSDGVALVTMKSGENRFHPETIREWHTVLDRIEGVAECKAMITTGQGKYYSNGLDLEYAKTFIQPEQEELEYKDLFYRLMRRVLLFPMVTVAAVNGHAFAGGAVISAAHDFRVMREDRGWLSFNELQVNVSFTPGLMSLMRAKLPIGPVQRDAILTAKRYTAQEAFEAGIVDKVSSNSQLQEKAKQIALDYLKTNSSVSRQTIQNFKKELYRDVYD